MNNINRAIIAQNTPLRLTAEQMENPMGVIVGFFEDFDLEDSRDLFWFLVSKVLCLNDEDLDEFSRSDILMYYEDAEKLIEAVSLVCQRQGNLGRTEKPTKL